VKHEDVVEAVAGWFKTNKDVVLISKTYGKGFPNPDVRAQYRGGEICVAECKGSGASGREYATGMGQCIAYLTFAEFAYLALPRKELQEYQRYFWVNEIGLLSVKDDFNVRVVRPAQKSKVLTTKEEPRVRGYGYYRDLRPPEIHMILKAIQTKRVTQKKLDVKQIEEAMWKQVLKIRNIKSQRQRNAWILNMKLLLRDLQLINLNDYSLTDEGFRLLQLGGAPKQRTILKRVSKMFFNKCQFFRNNYTNSKFLTMNTLVSVQFLSLKSTSQEKLLKKN
jgi:hypothetical protein